MVEGTSGAAERGHFREWSCKAALMRAGSSKPHLGVDLRSSLSRWDSSQEVEYRTTAQQYPSPGIVGCYPVT